MLPSTRIRTLPKSCVLLYVQSSHSQLRPASARFYAEGPGPSLKESTARVEDAGQDIPKRRPSTLETQPDFTYDDAQDLDLVLTKVSQTNQYMHVDEETREKLRQILWQFRAPIRYAFAYGSGIFSQGGTAKKRPMIDLVFGVSYTQHWHSLNLAQHPDHYSFLRWFGSGAVSHVQDKMGAGIFYNANVDLKGTLIKYGVVNIDTLCRDLTEWDTLYMAGRLQKPVKVLRDDARVRIANQANLISALRVALLLLPDKFSETQLFRTIAGISYMGDPRMSLMTENPHKVANIVDNQLGNFRKLYGPLIEQLPNVYYLNPTYSADPNTAMLVQDMNPFRRGNMVRRLPKAFRKKLYFLYQRKFQIPTLEFEKMIDITVDQERKEGRKGGEFEQRIANDRENIRNEVGRAIKQTVWWPSMTQSLKGVLTAGPVKSFGYVVEKVGKWKSAKRNAVESAADKKLQ